jgi:O-acetyl-ADP-ribose deacetylase (regulator of RNase III)
VIHTVGPNRNRGQTDPELLASAFRRSLEVATQVGARSVAFPAVSAGAYGWDADEVARIAVSTVQGWTAEHADVDLVRFVLFGPRTSAAFERALSA